MELNLLKMDGSQSGNVQLSDAVFARDYNEPLIHQVVNAYLAGARAGTRGQKSRAVVKGGGAKPWRQKGTGRARAGSSRSPLWRGGGKTFAATVSDYSQKVNKKMHRGAMRSILSELARQDRLVVVEDFSVDAPKTKELVKKLSALGLGDVLIVTDHIDDNLYLSARNLANVDVKPAGKADPVSLVSFEKVLMTQAAAKRLEEMLG